MSFRTKTPVADDIPVEPEDLSSSQEAVPVPWFWGRRLVALRPCTNIIEQITIERKNNFSKK